MEEETEEGTKTWRGQKHLPTHVRQDKKRKLISVHRPLHKDPTPLECVTNLGEKLGVLNNDAKSHDLEIQKQIITLTSIFRENSLCASVHCLKAHSSHSLW